MEKKELTSRERLAILADEKGIHNLSKALRDPKNIATCKDIQDYGWIRCSTALPETSDDVLVTDGKLVWIGDYNNRRNRGKGEWALVYNGATPFESTEVIAWIYMPEAPTF